MPEFRPETNMILQRLSALEQRVSGLNDKISQRPIRTYLAEDIEEATDSIEIEGETYMVAPINDGDLAQTGEATEGGEVVTPKHWIRINGQWVEIGAGTPGDSLFIYVAPTREQLYYLYTEVEPPALGYVTETKRYYVRVEGSVDGTVQFLWACFTHIEATAP